MAQVRLKKQHPDFPQAQVGQTIQVDDAKIDRLERDGVVERISANQGTTANPSGGQRENMTGGDKPR